MQQQGFSIAGIPVAHAGWGLDIPNASTAIRIRTKVLKRTAMLKQL